MRLRAERLAKMGLLLAAGMLLSYIESLFPIAPTLPGVKLGLANLPAVMLLYTYGAAYALLYQLARLLLSALLFGNLYSFLYSLAGAALCMPIMVLQKRIGWLDIPGTSMCGGIFHNVGQLIAAYLFVQNAAIGWYLPMLLVSGAVCGYLTGLLAEILVKRSVL